MAKDEEKLDEILRLLRKLLSKKRAYRPREVYRITPKLAGGSYKPKLGNYQALRGIYRVEPRYNPKPHLC